MFLFLSGSAKIGRTAITFHRLGLPCVHTQQAPLTHACVPLPRWTTFGGEHFYPHPPPLFVSPRPIDLGVCARAPHQHPSESGGSYSQPPAGAPRVGRFRRPLPAPSDALARGLGRRPACRRERRGLFRRRRGGLASALFSSIQSARVVAGTAARQAAAGTDERARGGGGGLQATGVGWRGKGGRSHRRVAGRLLLRLSRWARGGAVHPPCRALCPRRPVCPCVAEKLDGGGGLWWRHRENALLAGAPHPARLPRIRGEEGEGQRGGVGDGGGIMP